MTEELLKTLQDLGGYYECPKDASGNRLGPLVGYTGRYEDGLQYVGDVYLNFAKLEHRPAHLHHVAFKLSLIGELTQTARRCNPVFCGAPEGSKALAAMLAFIMDRRYVYPEKETISLKTSTSRERSRFV